MKTLCLCKLLFEAKWSFLGEWLGGWSLGLPWRRCWRISRTFRLLLWQEGKGNGSGNTADARRAGSASGKRLIAWLCTRWGRSLEMSAVQPHLPQPFPVGRCSSSLSLVAMFSWNCFLLSWGESSRICWDKLIVWFGFFLCCFCFFFLFPKAVCLLTPPCLCLGSPRQCDGLQALSLHPCFGGEVGRDLHRGRCAQGALQCGAGWSGHRPVPLSSPRCGQNLFHWQCANWHQGKGTFTLGDTRCL